MTMIGRQPARVPLRRQDVESSVLAEVQAGRRNFVLNPSGEIAQRGTGPFASIGNYTLDRWHLDFASSYTVNQGSGLTPGSESSLMLLTSGTNPIGSVSQYLESKDTKQLQGRTVTLSAYITTDVGSINIDLVLNKSSTPDSATSHTNMEREQFTATTTTQRVSITTTVPDDGTAETVAVQLVPSSASQAGLQLHIEGIQLEIGDAPTEFNPRPYGLEERLCFRYYQPIFIGSYQCTGVHRRSSVSGQFVGERRRLPVIMRATPTTVEEAQSWSVASALNTATNFSSGTGIKISVSTATYLITLQNGSVAGSNGALYVGRTGAEAFTHWLDAEIG